MYTYMFVCVCVCVCRLAVRVLAYTLRINYSGRHQEEEVVVVQDGAGQRQGVYAIMWYTVCIAEPE